MSSNPCQATTGIIITRPCNGEAQFECAQCGKALCTGHVVRNWKTMGPISCQECAQGSADNADRSDDSDSSDSSYDDSDSWYANRSSPSWYRHQSRSPVDPSRPPPVEGDPGYDTQDGSTFTDEDYAAFDETSDFDKNFDKDGSFDS